MEILVEYTVSHNLLDLVMKVATPFSGMAIVFMELVKTILISLTHFFHMGFGQQKPSRLCTTYNSWL